MIELENAVVFHGSNLDVLPTLPDNSVDAIVTDPPYELGFMGKSWDSSGIAYSVELWQECLRVLKPGGHLLAFGGSRTWHRIAVAIEDAGFDVRDSIAWLYGSGFPKSYNIAKGIEGQLVHGSASWNKWHKLNGTLSEATGQGANGLVKSNAAQGNRPTEYASHGSLELEPTTDEAKKWQGWGTALKPAFEPIVVARKPLVGTVAANVLLWGVGGLNIDGSRIGTGTGETKTVEYPDIRGGNYGQDGEAYADRATVKREVKDQGRWPANIILDEHTAGLLDQQSGVSTSLSHNRPQATKWGFGVHQDNSKQYDYETGQTGYGDTGGASRFFYVAKASKKDRNEGLEDLPEIQTTGGGGLTAELNEDGFLRTDSAGGKFGSVKAAKQNFHPTVKPTALMEYLVKLVTPPGGTVLDPFTGSGSTGKAALLNGFKFIGIELTADYLPIIEGRLKHAAETYANKATEEETKEQETLF
jgi:site-specific DNA-methyltransferase (adenine-specific)